MKKIFSITHFLSLSILLRKIKFVSVAKKLLSKNGVHHGIQFHSSTLVLHDFLVTVKAAPHECVIRTGQP